MNDSLLIILLSRQNAVKVAHYSKTMLNFEVTKNVCFVGRAVTRLSLERGSEVQISGQSNRKQSCQRLATSVTFSSKGAVQPERSDAEMGPANSLHASAYYSQDNERFNLIQKYLFCKRSIQ